MTRDEALNLGNKIMTDLLQTQIGQPLEVRRIITEHTDGLDREQLLEVLGNLLGESMDIGAILAVALERHPDAQAEALKLREHLEFARITSRIYDDSK
ncbi:hypothetical protein [Microcella alkalica]|uniref:hypothetical protein n=1 Tax=Microcella alkalica TaxID=355930 RepID=UPI00145F9426|nr:hypothetical protein [Microcella alkalica]